jgi:glutathionyl-hydroquinone reductase
MHAAAAYSGPLQVNEWVYECINNGVYRCGFATAQAPYEEAFECVEELQGIRTLCHALAKNAPLDVPCALK